MWPMPTVGFHWPVFARTVYTEMVNNFLTGFQYQQKFYKHGKMLAKMRNVLALDLPLVPPTLIFIFYTNMYVRQCTYIRVYIYYIYIIYIYTYIKYIYIYIYIY